MAVRAAVVLGYFFDRRNRTKKLPSEETRGNEEEREKSVGYPDSRFGSFDALHREQQSADWSINNNHKRATAYCRYLRNFFNGSNVQRTQGHESENANQVTRYSENKIHNNQYYN